MGGEQTRRRELTLVAFERREQVRDVGQVFGGAKLARSAPSVVARGLYLYEIEGLSKPSTASQRGSGSEILKMTLIFNFSLVC